jgi:hypothetical protein
LDFFTDNYSIWFDGLESSEANARLTPAQKLSKRLLIFQTITADDTYELSCNSPLTHDDHNLMNEFAYLEKDLFKANANQYLATDSDTNCATSISNDSFTSET